MAVVVVGGCAGEHGEGLFSERVWHGTVARHGVAAALQGHSLHGACPHPPGVIFSAPVPNSRSTYSSAMMAMRRPL